MVDIYACICGSIVADNQRVMGSNMALHCGFEGCKMSWVCISNILSQKFPNSNFLLPITVSFRMPQF